MDDERRAIVTLDLVDGYQFTVDLGQAAVAPILMDEPPPLGAGSGPNAARMLAASVGHCLSASALFCLRKARIPVSTMRTTVEVTLQRDARGRLRVGGIRVDLRPEIAAADRDRIGRCLELFEDFCVVTASIRRGIEVAVQVTPQATAPATA